MNAIPIRFWPAVGLITLWILAIACGMFGGMIDTFGTYCRGIAFYLAWFVVPFTIVFALIPRRHQTDGGEAIDRLTWLSIILRVLVALALSIVTLISWPRTFVSHTFMAVANDIRFAVPEEEISYLNDEVKSTIPRGEVELRDLSKEVKNQMFIYLDREYETDRWGNPYMFVAEDRVEGLWIGLYTKGQDGISNSKGNDPDDQNSWGQDGVDYYLQKINRKTLPGRVLKAGAIFTFHLSICLLTFRQPNRKARST